MTAGILIVDDTPDDRYILKRYLLKVGPGLVCHEVNDGEEALAFFEKGLLSPGTDFPPVVAFVDINMPRMGGLDFVEAFDRLRARHPGLSTVAVVMFSSSSREDERRRAEACECVRGYLVKDAMSVSTVGDLVRAFLPTAPNGE